MNRPSAADAQVYAGWLLRRASRPSDPAAFGEWLVASFYEDERETLMAQDRMRALCAVRTESELSYQLFWCVFEGVLDVAPLSWAFAYEFFAPPLDPLKAYRLVKSLVMQHEAHSCGEPFERWLLAQGTPCPERLEQLPLLRETLRQATTASERLVALTRSVLERRIPATVLTGAVA